MNENNLMGTHPAEGELVRLMDHQVSVEERRALLAHLSACDACAHQVDHLGAQSRMVSGYLADLHADAAADQMTRARALAAARAAAGRSHRRMPAVWLRAAAVAAVVVVTAGVSPVRAWVLDRIESILGDDAAPRATAPAVVPTPAPQMGSQVAFEPTGPVFNLEFDATQAVGELRLTLAPDARVAARVVGGGSDESFTLLPAGMLVDNAPASASSYEIAIPASVRTVQIFAGARLLGTVDVDGGNAGWERTLGLR